MAETKTILNLNDVIAKVIRYETSGGPGGGNKLLSVIPKDLAKLSSVISANSFGLSGNDLVLRSDADIVLNALDGTAPRDGSLSAESTISVLDQIRRMANIEKICLPLSGGMINVIDGLSTLTRTRQLVSEVYNFTGTLIVLSTFNEPKPWPCPGGDIASDYFGYEELGEGLVSAYHVPVSANWNIIVDGNYTPGTPVTASCDLGEFSIGTLNWVGEVIETQLGRGRSFGIQFSQVYPIVEKMRELDIPGYHNYWERLEYDLRVEFDGWSTGKSIIRFELNHDNIIGEMQDFSQWYHYPYYTFDNQERPLAGPYQVYDDVITAERVMTDADYNVIKRWNTENNNRITDISVAQLSISETPFVRQDMDSGISGNVEFMKNVTFDESLRNVRLGTLQELTNGWGRVLSREYLNTYSLRDVLDYMTHLGYDTGVLGNLKVPYTVNMETSATCISVLRKINEDTGENEPYGIAILSVDGNTLPHNESYNIPNKLRVEVEPGWVTELPVVEVGGAYIDRVGVVPIGPMQVNIPDTVVKINAGAFRDDIKGSTNSVTPARITIPDSVKYIDDYAFCGITVHDITFPKNLKYIGECALDIYLREYGHEGEERCLSVYINEEIEHIGATAFPSWDFRDTETKLYWNSYNPPPADIDSKISPECMDPTGVIRYPADADSRNWPTTIAGFSCIVDPEFFLDETKRTSQKYRPSTENGLVPVSYMNEKLSELSSSYQQTISAYEGRIAYLERAVEALLSGGTVVPEPEPEEPTPSAETSATFTWTDAEGEHTSYLSSLNNFTWTNDEGVHYYCVEHGVDNPECPEYNAMQEEHGGEDPTPEQGPSLTYTNSNGTQTVEGPMTINWTNHEGDHSITM